MGISALTVTLTNKYWQKHFLNPQTNNCQFGLDLQKSLRLSASWLNPCPPPKLGQFTDSVRIYRPRLGKSWPQCAPSNKWHQLSKGYLITRRTPTENLWKQLNIVRKYVEDQGVWTSRLSSKGSFCSEAKAPVSSMMKFFGDWAY